MEGEIGTFLALTGFELKNADLSTVKLTDNAMIDNTSDIENAIKYALKNRNIYDSPNNYYDLWPDLYAKYWEEKNIQNKNRTGDNLNPYEQKSLNYFLNNTVYDYPWNEDINNSNSPQSAKNSMLLNDLINVQKDLTNPDKSDKFNLREFKGRTYTNSAKNFVDLVYPHLPFSEDTGNSLSYAKNEINRCFRFNTVKEIINCLKEENTPFAEICLEMINKKSPISLEVTLKMLRSAKSLGYSEVIKQEINVVKNIVMNSPDFDLAMEHKINKKKDLKFSKSVFDYSESDINEYFKEADVKNIKLDLKSHTLLPQRQYLLKYPDCFRMWLNETPRANSQIRKLFEYEIYHYLFQYLGIDMRDTRLTLEEVRETMCKFETNKFIEGKNTELMCNLLADQKFINEYINKRKKLVEEYLNPNTDKKEKLKDLVNNKVKHIFSKVKYKNKIRTSKKKVMTF